jgi:hypothetical protein
LLNTKETKNATIRVEGAVAIWNRIIGLLEKTQGRRYTATCESAAQAHAKGLGAWSKGAPAEARFALPRVVAEANAKLPVVLNSMFPEIKITTYLEAIVRVPLKSKAA